MVVVVSLIIAAIIFCIGMTIIIWEDRDYTKISRIGVILIVWSFIAFFTTLIGTLMYEAQLERSTRIQIEQGVE